MILISYFIGQFIFHLFLFFKILILRWQYCIFQSEIYVVWDTIYYVENINDLGCSDNVQLSETSEGYYASTPSTTTDNQYVYFNKNGSNFRFQLDKSWCFELDFKTTNAVSFGTHNSTMGIRTLLGITSSKLNIWCNMKIKYDSDNGMVSGFVDDVEDTSRKITVSGTQGLNPRIIDFNKDIDVIFKNVKSYYI